jgi:hypothetical protein
MQGDFFVQSVASVAANSLYELAAHNRQICRRRLWL